MAIGPVNSSLQGIQRGLQDLSKTAQDIAGAAAEGETGPGALAESAVGLIQAEIQVKGSATALKVENEIMGSLLDIRA